MGTAGRKGGAEWETGEPGPRPDVRAAALSAASGKRGGGACRASVRMCTWVEGALNLGGGVVAEMIWGSADIETSVGIWPSQLPGRRCPDGSSWPAGAGAWAAAQHVLDARGQRTACLQRVRQPPRRGRALRAVVGSLPKRVIPAWCPPQSQASPAAAGALPRATSAFLMPRHARRSGSQPRASAGEQLLRKVRTRREAL